MSVFPTKRIASLSAAVVIGFSGVVVSAPAVFAKDTAAVAGAAFEKQGKELAQSSKVQGYTADGEGNVVIFKVQSEKLDAAAEEFVREHKNVKVVELDKPLEFAAGGEVVGGHPIGMTNEAGDMSSVCSTGFAMMSTDFQAQIATAGHCTAANIGQSSDITPGTATTLFWLDPTTSPAAGSSEGERPLGGVKGTLADWRFGGPGQTNADPNAGESGQNSLPNGEQYIDFATYNLSEYERLVPAVSKWGNPQNMVADSLPVTGVGEAKNGDTFARSGRTTGFKEGTVEFDSGWLNVSGRLVGGFGGYVDGAPGDSGGSAINSNGQAIGVLSGYGTDQDGRTFTWYSDLKNDLDQFGNKSRVLVQKAPALKGAASAAAEGLRSAAATAATQQKTSVPEGGNLTGTGADGFTGVTLLLDNGERVEGTVDGDNWSIPVPGQAGDTVTGKVLLTNTYEISSELAVEVTLTDATETTPAPEPSSTPAPEPSSSSTPAPEPSSTPAPDPTSTPAPQPTTTSAPAPEPTEEAKPALQVSPERIAVSKFMGDGENDDSVGVSYVATGLPAGSSVTFVTKFGGETVKTTTGEVNADGTASARVWGQSGSPESFLGTYEVTAETESGDLTGSFTVVSDEDAKGGQSDDDSQSGNELPRTGNNVLPSVGIALGMIALGGGFVAVARRRKENS